MTILTQVFPPAPLAPIPPPPGLPIDSGLFIFMLIGVIYGVLITRKRTKKFVK